LLVVLAVKVPKQRAEEVRKRLAEMDLLDQDHQIVAEGDFVFIPVKGDPGEFPVVEKDLLKKKPRDLKEALEGKIPRELIPLVPRSFDIVGSIAVMELPEELRPYEREIGEALLRVHPNLRTVAVEEGPHQGPFRVQPLRVIAGENSLVTEYREHGARMKLELGKVYFSVRHSFERKRIAEQVKPGEVVAALFAGVGPYPLVIAKKQPKVKKIYAVELNPEGYRWMKVNVELNKLQGKIIPVLGDVRDVVPRMFPKMAHRVIMPLPKSAEDFLDVAMEALRPEGGIIHLYGFGPAEDPFGRLEKRIREVAEEHGYRAEILERRKVADYAPYVWKVVVDAKLTRSKE